MSVDSAFVEARDALLYRRSDFDAAVREFRWPRPSYFNWALDYFDAIAADNAEPALRVVDDLSGDQSLSYADLSTRSSRLANFLVAQGIGRGDRILLMLGNVVPLWEAMLAAMKLGAVIIPATTMLSAYDLKDRFERGRVRHLVANAADAPK